MYLFLIAALLLVGYYIILKGKVIDSKSRKNLPAKTSTTGVKTVTKDISLAEVAKHNSGTDCWLAIEGKVYDVTSFVAANQHPGGKAILQGCGKEATTFFDTRPMGSKTPHSARARAMLSNYYIGNLK